MANTNDLINRGEAILAVTERIRQFGLDDDYHVVSIRQVIRDLPSAQRTGWWDAREVYYSCSNCGMASWWETNYCPHCGSHNCKREEGD